MTIVLSILMWFAPTIADLGQVRAEPNLEKRSRAALELAERSLKESRQAYGAGEMDKMAALLEEVGQCVELAETSLIETRKDPSKNPKHFKHAEIKTFDLLRKIDSFSQDMNAADRPTLEKLKENVQGVHDRLLQGIMMGKKK